MTIGLLTDEARIKLDKMCPSAHFGLIGSRLKALCEFMETFKTAEAAPVNAVAAVGKVTVGASNAGDGDTLKVGDVTYKFKTTLTSDPGPVANEILIGGSATDTASNIVLAIKAEGTVGEVGVKYSTGTVPHPLVEASSDAGVVALTAATKGVAGNSIALVKDGAHLTVTGATLGAGAGSTAGVNGSIGRKNELRFHGDYIYRATDDNGIDGANWVRLGTFASY